MTDEELQKLMDEVSGEIARLQDNPEEALTKAEKKHQRVLQARQWALERIKEAMEKGNISQEAGACMDYALLTEYGERNPILYNLAKSQTWWRGF